jgi:7-cyano-7-deazaguanine synthase
MSKARAVVALSGGMDSATVLGWALSKGFDVSAVGFDYGSKHGVYERVAAANVARHYGVPYRVIPIPLDRMGFKSDLLTTGGAIPEGHYEAETMKATVVPCRNLIFGSILAGLAESNGAEAICLGIHAGDHAIYPDCRREFHRAFADAVGEAT